MKNSIIILAKNIKLDKSYKNVLSYSESEMLSLLQEHLVARRENFSFINKNNQNEIQVSVPFVDCLKANYIGYQNPNYSNKWFFAFIDSVEYISDRNSRIRFTVDEFTTWHDYWTPKTCFVLREHVTNDTVGLHTIPEGLETGDFVCNSHIIDDRFDDILSDLVYVFAVSRNPYETDSQGKLKPVTGGLYNGIYQGNAFFRCNTKEDVSEIIKSVLDAGMVDIITGLFMAPAELCPTIDGGPNLINNTNAPITYTQSISKQTTINGYTPKNNKLLIGDYNYLIASNNNGSSVVYKYEDFSQSSCTFNINMVLTPGCSIRQVPTNYKGSASADEFGINMGKLPICSFNCDMYINWLTQNSINIGGFNVTSDDLNMTSSIISSVIGLTSSIATGSVTGSVGSTISGANSIVGSMMAKKQHELIPNQVRGNTNCGDVITATNTNAFHFYKMSIKQEYAKSIDDYFTAFGYQVNTLKTPNLTTRPHFNYVQIGSSDNIGYPTDAKGSVPAGSMEIINNIFRSGVTIWHQHVHLGNYSVDNAI